MYKKEFYHTKEDAYSAALLAAGERGIIDTNTCTASGFDFIAPDAINDERDGDCLAFLAYSEDGCIKGVFGYSE